MYTSEKISDKEVIVRETASTQESSFLFITGAVHENEEYQSYFSNCNFVANFTEAKHLLANTDIQPELIILDIPLSQLELVEFKVWLTANMLHKIPVIYNETALKTEQIMQLFRQKLVDDVVHIKLNYNKLKYKARFIKKLNTNDQTETAIHGTTNNNRDIIIRSIDILISLIAIICFLPLILIIAIAVKLESKGPVFYSALRAGEGFRIFKFYKFRTMIVDADKKIAELASKNIYSSGTNKANFFKIKDDPRITKLGMFLRNSSLDELPQFFNVLKGDMSIVGNRPLPLYEATSLTTNEWAERFMAPAGITGLWQISKRGKAEMSNEERILLDINYARNRSLKGDLKILIQTPTALMQKTNV
jgi:lipopolysaccharide/colanic/teichoic acid biosynthesis glycosyltransferase